ncbi:MAG: transcriptional regulator, LysR family [Clostridia bacterium]|jgi:DNA-binding transcriptional LysR family regulator|nr:transcriptional regulator, LysR family [Clostridia bacterium]
MDVHYLKLFNIVAAHESYTKAAGLLHISQPALSIQIKKLEEELDLKLFDKVGNKVILNENGKILFNYTQKIFGMLDEAEAILVNKRKFIGGSINIGGSNTPGAYILPHIIGAFKKQYPFVKINLHISNTDDIGHLIEEGSLDFAVNGGDMVYNNNVYTEKLMEDKLVIVASSESSFSNKKYMEVSELQSMQFIVHENNSQLYRVVKKFIDEFELSTKKIVMNFGHIDAIKQAVIANLGVSLIPLSAIQLELKMGLIKELRLNNKTLVYPYSLIYNKNKYLSPATLEMIKMVRDMMQSEYQEV